MTTPHDRFRPRVGDVIGWALLPHGDELVVRSVDANGFIAQRGHAEHFFFDAETDPQPHMIEEAHR